MELKIQFDVEQIQEICKKAVIELGGVGFAGCAHCPHRDEDTGLCHKVLDTFGTKIFTADDSDCIWFSDAWKSKEDAKGMSQK